MQTVSIKEQKIGELIQSETINGVVRAIVDNFAPEKIILFGSYVNDNPSIDSDLDLLIVMESNLPKHKRSVPIKMLFNPLPCAMDILVYTPDEVNYWEGTVNHIITEAFKTGRVLYERT